MGAIPPRTKTRNVWTRERVVEGPEGSLLRATIHSRGEDRRADIELYGDKKVRVHQIHRTGITGAALMGLEIQKFMEGFAAAQKFYKL